MKGRLLLTLAALVLANRADAQRKVREAGGDVRLGPPASVDISRLATRIPGATAEQTTRMQVGGDSAQRIAMNDFEWRGRVSSVELDEEDARVFWDVKIVPDDGPGTIVRYRVDALNGGILGIKEFTGVRALVSRPRP